MATIPMGTGGRALPGRGPNLMTAPVGQVGARALEDFGRTGVQIGLQLQSDQTRLIEQDRQLQVAEQADAEKAAATRELGEATLRLRTRAQELAERVLAGEATEEQARSTLTVEGGEIMNEHSSRVGPKLREAVAGPLRLKTSEYAETVIRPAVRERLRETTRADVMQSLEMFEREAVDDRPRSVARATALVQELGRAAGWGVDDQFRELQTFRERTAYTLGERVVTGAGRDMTALEAAGKVLQGPDFADLSPDARQRLEVQISNRRAQAEHAQQLAAQRAAAAVERRSREAEDAAKSLQMLIDGGAVPSDDFLKQVQGRTSGTLYAPVVQAAVAQAAERAGFASLLPERQREQILGIRAQLTAQGSNPAMEKRLAKLEEIASSSADKAQKEPLRWALDTRLLADVRPLQLTDINGLAAQLSERVNQAATVGAALRRPVSPFLGSEATRVGELLGSLPWAQQSGAVRTLAAQMPAEQQRALAAQVSGGDQPLALAMYASTLPSTPGVDLPALILRGADAEKTGRVKRDDTIVNADRTSIARELAKVAWPTPQARDAAVNASVLTYQGLRDQKNGGSASWREAVKMATGELAEVGASKVPVPPGWTERRFRNAIASTDAATLQGQMRGPVFVNGTPVQAEALAKSLTAATWIPLAPGQYALDVGGLVMTADRKPWVFTVRDF